MGKQRIPTKCKKKKKIEIRLQWWSEEREGRVVIKERTKKKKRGWVHVSVINWQKSKHRHTSIKK